MFDIYAFADWIFVTDNILSILAALFVFATVWTLATPAIDSDPSTRRLKQVAEVRDALRKKAKKELEQPKASLRVETTGFFKSFVEGLNLQKLLEDSKLKTKLDQAGLRGQKPVFVFYFARFVTPFVLLGFGLFYIMNIDDFGLDLAQKIATYFGLFGLGYYAPGMYLGNIASKRRDSIKSAFPDSLDLLLICVESGMSIEAAFKKVSEEIGTNSLPLAEELSLLNAELSYLQDRRQAYENLGKRTNLIGVKSVTTALVQAERYGTPLGEALRVLAKENRDLRMNEAEKKAAALPAKLTVPMIAFFLPVLFVIIISPAILSYIDAGVSFGE